ncbi:MAG: hypothetical protein DMD47_07675 [Gemmatimonadetes bacterium]|nr:MAG: hypothetical protein DMD47_07675 [Gemmatimonadota bacterium]
MFRSKLAAVVDGAGAVTGRDPDACDLAVVDVELPGAADRIRSFVERRIPVLAYGAHVRPELLRAAREAGATAVPNSQVQERLASFLKA